MRGWNDVTPLQTKLYIIIFESDTRAGRLFDLVLLLAIFLSIIVVSLETIRSLRAEYGFYFRIIEWALTIIFTLEYFLRIYSAKDSRQYLFSFFGIVDFLSILPTYLSLSVSGAQTLIVIRSLRLLRVFRILKLTQFVGEATLLKTALWASRRKIAVFIGSVVSLAIILGAIMYLVEGEQNGFTSIPIGIYWTVVTMTTVGYGDIAPQTPLGQAIAVFVMILGYGIIAVPTGIVTIELSQAYQDISTRKECTRCFAKGHHLNAQFCWSCGGRMD